MDEKKKAQHRAAVRAAAACEAMDQNQVAYCQERVGAPTPFPLDGELASMEGEVRRLYLQAAELNLRLSQACAKKLQG